MLVTINKTPTHTNLREKRIIDACNWKDRLWRLRKLSSRGTTLLLMPYFPVPSCLLLLILCAALSCFRQVSTGEVRKGPRQLCMVYVSWRGLPHRFYLEHFRGGLWLTHPSPITVAKGAVYCDWQL